MKSAVQSEVLIVRRILPGKEFNQLVLKLKETQKHTNRRRPNLAYNCYKCYLDYMLHIVLCFCFSIDEFRTIYWNHVTFECASRFNFKGSERLTFPGWLQIIRLEFLSRLKLYTCNLLLILGYKL